MTKERILDTIHRCQWGLIQKYSFVPNIDTIICDTPFVICDQDTAKKQYYDAMEECHSFGSGFSPYVLGEIIYGINGSKLLVYSYNIRDDIGVAAHTIYHEYGHLIANSEIKAIMQKKLEYFIKKHQSNDPEYEEHLPYEERRYYERLLWGTTLWGEFIADIVACSMFTDIKHVDCDIIKNELSREFFNIIMYRENSSYVGHYMAAVIGNPIVVISIPREERLQLNLERMSDDFRHAFYKLFVMLEKQIKKKNIFKISMDDILTIGECAVTIMDDLESVI